MGQPIRISRLAMYEKIWSTPISRVAKEYHLSDVGLAKICKRHQIPRPPLGYWARIQHGQEPRKMDLPPVSDDRLETVEITVSDMPDLSTDPSLKTRADTGMASIEEPEFKIVVTESLDHAHTLVQKAIASFRGGKGQ